MRNYCSIEVLKGITLVKVEQKGDDEIIFHSKDQEYLMFHLQECCENVIIDDIVGDLQDLVDSPIVKAEEVKNDSDYNPELKPKDGWKDSFTWTFYKLATIKGYVTIKWYGVSNGYYSESVSFMRVK